MIDPKEIIAARVAKELKDGEVVNLGIGLPTLAANYLPQNSNIVLQSENGILNMGCLAKEGYEDFEITNAGGKYSTVKSGAVFMDSAFSFGIIRGGHIDTAVLGALEVDEKGNLANWIIPNVLMPGMGGAMDLAAGAKKIIAAMLHSQKGKPKIVKKCSLPYTALKVINMIITEMAVIEVVKEGLLLKEIHSDYSLEEVKKLTGARLIINSNIGSF